MKKFKFFNTASAVLLAVFVGAMSFTCGQSDNKATDEVQTVVDDTLKNKTIENDTTIVEVDSSDEQDNTMAPEASEKTDNSEAIETSETTENEAAQEASK